MHLLEKYSLNCGINPLKLKKSEIYSSYYPIQFEKYIVIHASSGMPSKNYSYFQDIIDFVSTALNKNGYGIVQIGGKEDIALNNCLNLQGVTNIHQTAFILKNASLLLGNDSFSTHFCSSFGVPLVSLYSIIQPEVAGPYWKNEKQFTISAPLNGKKPKYSAEDPDRDIDKIKPEEILLRIKKAIPGINLDDITIPETIFIGKKYHEVSLHFVPDSIQKIENIQNQILNIRFDLLKNSDISDENLYSAAVNINDTKCRIVTSKPFDFLKILNNQNISNLDQLIFKIKKENLSNVNEIISFAINSKKIGINIKIQLNESEFSESEINDLKFNFLDIHPIEIVNNSTSVKEFDPDLLRKNKKSLIFKTRKLIISNGRYFSTEASFIENAPINAGIQQKFSEIKNQNRLLQELDYIYFYNK